MKKGIVALALAMTMGMAQAADIEDVHEPWVKSETWHNRETGGMQWPNITIDFYLYADSACELRMYQNPSIPLSAGKIVATDTKTGDYVTLDACWFEQKGKVYIYDEARREFTQPVSAYTKSE